MNKHPVPRGHCVDCGVDFALHRAMRPVTDPMLQDKEIDIYVCPECGSYGVEETVTDTQDLCTVVFRLKNGPADAGRFIYALACRVEQCKDVEVVSLRVGDEQYLTDKTDKSTSGVDHEQ